MMKALGALALGLSLAGLADAAILLSPTPSAVSTSVAAPPVVWSLGASGASSRWSTLALSSNATQLTGAIAARAGADVTAVDFVRLANQRSSTQAVTLTATQLSNAQLDVFTFAVYNGASLVGTLDMEAASPSLAFNMGAGATYTLTMRLDLADGAGDHNAPASLSLDLRVGSNGLVVDPAASAPTLPVSTVDVPFGKLVAGSSVGANSTNASGSSAAALVLSATTDYYYLNNTATSASFVKLVKTSNTGGVSALTTMNLGVRNSTGASVDHVKLSGGSFTQTEGTWQRLEPSSTNRIYVTSLEGALFASASVTFDVYASDTSTGDSYALTKGSVTLT